MKRYLKIFAFLIGTILMLFLVICSNEQLFNYCGDLIPDPYRYGDLYFFSNLPGYKENAKARYELKPTCASHECTLTVVGDSYTAPFDSSIFTCDDYQFFHWDNTPVALPTLNPNKRNVLVVATTERYCRWRLLTESIFNSSTSISNDVTKENNFPSDFKCEDELQFLLTNGDFLLPIKECRASLRRSLFQTVDERVAMPINDGRLYLRETIDSTQNASCFQVVSDEEIVKLQKNILKLEADLIAQGFDEVYFSIIPNAASIYRDNGEYNHLIERIERAKKDDDLFIDIYYAMKTSDQNCFLISDSHWNNHGKKFWVDRVNNILCGNTRH
jgi:hypothetical protein